ncbi:MAG: sugar transferase [Bacteroidales bacterium]|nr:sugar transferase [Bacteroidales bacterium]MCF8455991.1 sugar transferase [Bacteroidales bacterium]
MEIGQTLLQGRGVCKCTPVWKRFFDVFFALLLLILFSPVFILIIIVQQLESPGSIFYISPRVGAGYRIFPFFKFRSMVEGADEDLSQLAKTNNLYRGQPGGKSGFIKIENDPRITQVGKFIRSTGLDELPQLINVLRGEMSIVGNRPIPLYEAQMLIAENNLERFNAPGGITGLWQVSKRNNKPVTNEERITLDNAYLSQMNPLTDLKILAKTVLVVFAAANV